MIEAFAEISESDMKNLGKAIDLMVKGTNRDIKQATHRAAYTFLVSAKANTPIAKGKNRRIRGNGKFKFYAIHGQQGLKTKKVVIPQGQSKKAIAARKDIRKNFQKKPNVGVSKKSWNRAFNDLGKPIKGLRGERIRSLDGVSRAKEIGIKFSPTINIINELTYLLNIAPNVQRIAMDKAGRKLLDMVEKGIEKRNRRWK